MTRKVLGLDLGTNSIGWGIIELRNTSVKPVIDGGVHIFSEGVKIEKGNESSKAAERTGYRSARKVKYRRKLRKQETLSVLIKNGMCPLTETELQAWKKDKKAYPKNDLFLEWLRTDDDTGINPYYFRAKAVESKLPLHQLGRAFYHLAQRRGFLSNRLDNDSDEGEVAKLRKELRGAIETETDVAEFRAQLELILSNYQADEEPDKDVKRLSKSIEKALKDGAAKTLDELGTAITTILDRAENLGVVKKEIADLTREMNEAGCETMGQYFYQKYQQGQKIRKRHTSREEHYLREFNKICDVQGVSPALKTALYKAIFFQRPLRSQKGLVGKCSLEKTKPRCPVSHPAYEEFRALQFINSIKVGETEREKRFLTKAEKEKIWPKFVRKSKPTFKFEELAQALTPKGETLFFNYKNFQPVSGCPTAAQLVIIFGSSWQNAVCEAFRANSPKSGGKTDEQIINDVWHALFSFDNNEMLEKWGATHLGLNEKDAKKFSRIILKNDYASLSLKAINNILPFLREGLLYSHAVFLAGTEKVLGKDLWANETEREKIITDLKAIIDSDKAVRQQEILVNDLIGHFRQEYNNGHKDYQLDERDRKDVLEYITASYGEKGFARLSSKEQNDIIATISALYERQLRKHPGGQFIKPRRLDDRIAEMLMTKYGISEKAIEKMYHPSDIEMFKPATPSGEDQRVYLGSPKVASIRNPMAMRTLHQLRKLLNTMIREGMIDQETVVHIELARELNDANKRYAIQQYQKERLEKRAGYAQEIKELYQEQTGRAIEPTEIDIEKYELWTEQEHVCLYTGKRINLTDFIGSDPKFDIEHTIPRSLGNDNSMMNKTLCEMKYNREVKRNRIPTEVENYAEIKPRLSTWLMHVNEFEAKYNSRLRARGIETKEQKDRRIRDKHYFKLHLDYWKGKVDRFTREDVPSGFKNSQLVDTGIITKYARAYLKSVFENVYAVKGEIVAEFRKRWGIQEEYVKKERTDHLHHLIDALTIAGISKDKYEVLAHAWGLEDKQLRSEMKQLIEESKPWPTFREDVFALTQQVLVSHHTGSNATKQNKKKLRVKGQIQYQKVFETNEKGERVFKDWVYKKDKNGDRIPLADKSTGEVMSDKQGNDLYQKQPIYLQGDTARGALHKETFYGAIKVPGETDGPERYVVRKAVDALSASDIKNIVDPVIQSIIQEQVNTLGIKEAVKQGFKMKSGVEIKKVRCFAPSITDPIHLKNHRDLSKKEYKQSYHVANDENYTIAIYEGVDKKGKVVRDYEVVQLLDAAGYHKLSNSASRKEYPLVPEAKEVGGKEKILIPFKYALKKGDTVLFYNHEKEEVWGLSKKELSLRYYKMVTFDKFGRLYFRPHLEARPATELTEVYEVSFDHFQEQLRIPVSKLKILVENVDFRIDALGKITPIGRVS